VPNGEAAFTEYVASKLRRETRAAVVVKEPLTLGLGDIQANLDRIFAFCRADPAGCSQEVSHYVKGVAEIYAAKASKAAHSRPSKEAVRVVVRTQAYVTSSRATFPKGIPKPLAGSLVMLPVIDTPRTIRILMENDLGDLGLSADEVFSLGLANLSHRLKPLMAAKAVRPGQIGHIGGDDYNSSRLALLESWSPLAKAQGGKLIVAVPATDTVLYIGDDSPTVIDVLRLLVNKVSAQAPNPLSTELFRWTPSQWEAIR
jgi:uncharacterized protein YtpQ (UPF0354 family)